MLKVSAEVVEIEEECGSRVSEFVESMDVK